MNYAKELRCLKKCKNCNGKGYIFYKSTSIFTGRTTYFGLPKLTSGYEKGTCPKCYGNGMK